MILGLNLQNVTSVTVDGQPAPVIAYGPFGVFIIILAPPHALGNVPITVTGPSGSATANYLYLIGPPVGPAVSFISPNIGPVTGGTPFTITGTNLTGASVTFNGIPATNIVVNVTGTSLTGLTPPGAAGNATVQVTTPTGTTTVPGGYTYATTPMPPTAGAINPATGTTAGGTAVTVTGTNLTGASVTIGGVPATNVVVNA
ncbi:IPT/TIG domain-containing protein, partial [Streptomyces kronopolitis]|uniref:IPT/TIG domain-containing protein n=1 Tax=Streptomyces kronopolitis TaxID=1612435 RepID=UPI00341F08E8